MATALLTFALFAAGCSSEPKPGPGAEARMPRKPFTPIGGQEEFFAGEVLAEVHVGTEGMPDVKPGEGGNRGTGGGENRGRRGRSGSPGGQMSIAGGAGGFGGNIGGNVPFGEGGRREGGPSGSPRFTGVGGGGRPVMIHLRFTNRTETKVDLVITDFVSPLGNFAVRPEKLTLEPGQSLETEPMTSQLAGAFTETTATLVLRVAGKSEKKSFALKPVAPPPGNE